MNNTDYYTLALELHEKNRGKLEIKSKVSLKTEKDLSIAYTPGVAKPCLEIEKDENLSFKYTNRGNTIAIVTDGTAVLGLGDIGGVAALPVMEGKAILFKEFAGIDAIPICLSTTDKDEIVNIIKKLEPTFGGINLEDIGAPNCFYIEEELKKVSGIPIFHDDQHGTAVVTLAGLINALKLVKKDFNKIKVVINGSGAAGIAICKILLDVGVKNLIMCDRNGAIYKGRTDLNKYKKEISLKTNRNLFQGDLRGALKKADVFIGVSKGGVLKENMLKSMNKDPIVFAMANPEPEIMPKLAKKFGAKITATGRSDFPNQINNVLAFPGILKGALEVRAKDINEEMKVAAAKAIASMVEESELSLGFIVPSILNKEVTKQVAKYVAEAALNSGVARINVK